LWWIKRLPWQCCATWRLWKYSTSFSTGIYLNYSSAKKTISQSFTLLRSCNFTNNS
jgi:hypothetical protein